MPVSLREQILHAEHYLPIAAHPGECRLYGTMQKNFSWPHSANAAYQTVAGRKRHLQLFPVSVTFGFIAMEILDPLTQTKNRNEFITVITDRYSKITSVNPALKSTATHVANCFSIIR